MRSPSSWPTSRFGLPLLVLVIACGGPEAPEFPDTAPSPVAPELFLTGPSSAALIWGDSSSVELSLTRNETAVDAVTLSIEGLPEGVTATFEPATLSGDVLATTLHLEAARDAARASAPVTVRATGPEALVAEHAFALDVDGRTVEGSVETFTGQPLNRPLAVKVGTQWVDTDARGHFVAHQVAIPYDLVLKGERITEIYTDLRTATPAIRGFVDPGMGSVGESMRVTGTITPAPSANERITVCASNAGPGVSACATFVGDSRSAFNLRVPLVGPPTGNLQLIARREILINGRSSGYFGYAEAELVDAPGTTQVRDLVLAPSSNTPISFSLDLAGRTHSQSFGVVSYGAFLNGRKNIPPDVLHLPEGAQGAITVLAVEETGGLSITIQPVTGPLEAPIRFAPPVPTISPVHGATLDEDVTFVLADPAGSLVTHIFTLSGNDRVLLHTFGTQLPFAELAGHVDGLTPADIRSWYVVTAPDITTPEGAFDALAGYPALVEAVNGAIDPATLTEPLQRSLSSPRTFAAPVPPTTTASPLEQLLTDLFP